MEQPLDSDDLFLIEPLGSGGTADVYRAGRYIDDTHFQELCVKELQAKHRDDEESLFYFRREAAIASDLRHPNIVSLVAIDFARFRIIYELIDGVDLRRVLNRARDRKLSPEVVIEVAIRVTRALACAHRHTRADAPAGIIHRDVTPANVLISYDGDIKLADFGTATIQSADPQTSKRGTAPYMSPEQLHSRSIDGRADLFSLGVILYEALVGHRPFDGDGTFDYPPLEEVAPHTPPALIEIVTKLLQPKREERFDSAKELFDALSPLSPSPQVVYTLGALVSDVHKRTTKAIPVLQALRAQRLRHQSPRGAAVDDTVTPQQARLAMPAAKTTYQQLLTAPASAAAVTLEQSASSATTSALHRPHLESALSGAAGETLPSDQKRVVPATPTPEQPAPPAKARALSTRSRVLLGAVGASLVVGLLFLPGAHSRFVNDDTKNGVETRAHSSSAEAPALERNLEAPSDSRVTQASAPSTADAGSTRPLLTSQTSNPIALSDTPELPGTDDAPAAPTPLPTALLRVGAPQSVRVWLDGQIVGWTPYAARVPAGEHTVIVGEAPTRRVFQRTMMKAGATVKLWGGPRRP